MLILASASPRRRELLERLGIALEIEPAEIDETPRPSEPARAYAERLAAEKAQTISARHPDRFVLAADTVVILGEAILGKARDASEAAQMLRGLSGRTHEVATAYHVLGPRSDAARVITTEVAVASLSAREIDAYLESREWEGKAGAYAIQGIFGYAVTAISGSYTNVVGLPVAEVVADLVRLGALPGFPPHGFRR